MGSDGLYIDGVPVRGNDMYRGWWGANTWFVDSDNGSDSNEGSDSTSAFSTISAAVTAASAYDVIYVRPRVPATDASDPEVYAEELTIPYAKNHLSVVGTTHKPFDNFYGPKLKLGTADAVVDVYAPAFTLEGFTVHRRSSNTKAIYLRGITGYGTMAGSVNSHISNCMIRYASTQGIYIEWGYHSSVNNCTFWGGVSDCYITGQAVPQRGMQVRNCTFMSANGTVTAGPHIRLLGASTEVLIDHCRFDAQPSGTIYIQATGVVDGLINDCSFSDAANTTNAAAAAGEIQLGSGSLSITNSHGGTGALIAQA
jgi:hypothetical protein